MLEKPDVEQIYREWQAAAGDFSAKNNTQMFIITSDAEFETHFGRKADKNRKLYNGMLMCRLYIYL
jgi:putative N6-adenine-specific DNA methylase